MLLWLAACFVLLDFFYFYLISCASFPLSLAVDHLGNSAMCVPHKSVPFLRVADSGSFTKGHVTIAYFKLHAGTSNVQAQVLLKTEQLRTALQGHTLPVMLN